MFVQCRERSPAGRDISAQGARVVRRLLHVFGGTRYRAGDTLLIILMAPGYLLERAMVKIRNGLAVCRIAGSPARHIPQVVLLSA
jgi:hypothetical protein